MDDLDDCCAGERPSSLPGRQLFPARVNERLTTLKLTLLPAAPCGFLSALPEYFFGERACPRRFLNLVALFLEIFKHRINGSQSQNDDGFTERRTL